MLQEVYDKDYELENRYWWFLGRRYVFDKLLNRYLSGGPKIKIVDIGCGSGGNLSMLQKHGDVLGLDIEPRALAFCQSKGFDNVGQMKGLYETGLEDEGTNLVAMFDVLEHIQEEVRILREINRILKVDGYIIVSVPAFKFLWSELDDAAHHIRRYQRNELEYKLMQAGFEIVKSSYIFFFTFPLVFLYRLIGRFQKKRSHPQFSYVEFPKFLNIILTFCSKIESILLRFVRLPVGSSVVILARKVK